MISPPPATSSPRPSCTITRWTAVHGNALEANTTRERGQRAFSSSAYSRARARSAGSETTMTGVPNSSASASARQPATVSMPSPASALPGGKSESSDPMDGRLSHPRVTRNRRPHQSGRSSSSPARLD